LKLFDQCQALIPHHHFTHHKSYIINHSAVPSIDPTLSFYSSQVIAHQSFSRVKYWCIIHHIHHWR